MLDSTSLRFLWTLLWLYHPDRLYHISQHISLRTAYRTLTVYIRYSGSRRSRSQVWRKLEDIIRRDNQRSREVLAGDLIGIGPSIVPAIREARLEEGGPNVGECPWGCPSQCWGNQDTELKLYIFISVLEWGYGGWARDEPRWTVQRKVTKKPLFGVRKELGPP